MAAYQKNIYGKTDINDLVNNNIPYTNITNKPVSYIHNHSNNKTRFPPESGMNETSSFHPIPNRMPNRIPDRMPDRMSNSIQGQMPKRTMIENLPGQQPGNLQGHQPGHQPGNQRYQHGNQSGNQLINKNSNKIGRAHV